MSMSLSTRRFRRVSGQRAFATGVSLAPNFPGAKQKSEVVLCTVRREKVQVDATHNTIQQVPRIRSSKKFARCRSWGYQSEQQVVVVVRFDSARGCGPGGPQQRALRLRSPPSSILSARSLAPICISPVVTCHCPHIHPHAHQHQRTNSRPHQQSTFEPQPEHGPRHGWLAVNEQTQANQSHPHPPSSRPPAQALRRQLIAASCPGQEEDDDGDDEAAS